MVGLILSQSDCLENTNIEAPLTVSSFVLVPGAGSPEVESWPFCSRPWLSSMLPAKKSKFRLWTFDFAFPLEDRLSFENIWILGEKLLWALSEALRIGSPRPVGDNKRSLKRPLIVASRASKHLNSSRWCLYAIVLGA